MYRVLGLILAVMLLAGCQLPAQNVAVTGIEGESWLHHLARNFNETSMGKTGRLGPPAAVLGDNDSRLETQLAPLAASQIVTIHGADLYRLNCQGCHGESGVGAPPEINSIINPVRSTSVSLVMERMKTVGMDLSPETASEMARQSRKALLQRLHQGGQDMPPFPHLSEPEIRLLVAYLNQLAGVPETKATPATLQETRVRVGEHIAKSTCHICHSAAGSNPSPEQLLEGAIPPLSALTERDNLSQFVRKVTRGAPVLMGTSPLLYRGRMPVFGYLSQDEAADVYLYLTLRGPTAAIAAATSRPGGSPSPNGRLPHTHSSSATAADPEDMLAVSMARFALFPAILFVFLGSVVVRYLPRVANIGHDHKISGGRDATDTKRQPAAVAVSLGAQVP